MFKQAVCCISNFFATHGVKLDLNKKWLLGPAFPPHLGCPELVIDGGHVVMVITTLKLGVIIVTYSLFY